MQFFHIFMEISRSVILKIRAVPHNFVGKIEIYILASVPVFRNSFHLLHNKKKYDIDLQATENIIRSMSIAYWTGKATKKIFNIYIGLPHQQ